MPIKMPKAQAIIRERFDWSRYKVCPTCKAAAGEACVHTQLETTKGNPVYMDEPHTGRKKREMTVAEAKKIVREEYPDAITGNVRHTGWIAAKVRPYGSSIGDYTDTHGNAWKKAAERILKRRQEV